MDNRKKIFIVIGLVIALAVIIGLFLLLKNRSSSLIADQEDSAVGQAQLPAPEFLTTAEKQQLGIFSAVRIQSLGRDAAGQVTVYKIIRSDSDLVLDPASVAPLSPRQPAAAR